MNQLYDDSGTIVAVCAFFIAICIVLVVLRSYLRWVTATTGIDDYLFVVGLILWIVSTAFVIPACWNGLGAHFDRYTPKQGIAAQMYFFLFQHFYVWANIPIKTSICLTIIRIAADIRWITWSLYTIIGVLIVTSLVTNIYLLTDCQPLAATWDKSIKDSVCRAATGTVKLGYAYSAVNIVIDWTVALLPIFLLWRVQMRWRQKLPVMVVLALGIFASTATLVRLQTLTNFTNVDDYLWALGPIVIWTVIELALALIAGSLIAFRPLFRRFFASTSSRSAGTPAGDVYLRSFRSNKNQHNRVDSAIADGTCITADQSDTEITPTDRGVTGRSESQQSIIFDPDSPVGKKHGKWTGESGRGGKQ